MGRAVLDRAQLEERLRIVTAAFHHAGETEDTRLDERKLDAMSEFAAGGGTSSTIRWR